MVHIEYAIFDTGVISFVVYDMNDEMIYQEAFEFPYVGFEVMKERHPEDTITSWGYAGVIPSEAKEEKVEVTVDNVIKVNFR